MLLHSSDLGQGRRLRQRELAVRYRMPTSGFSIPVNPAVVPMTAQCRRSFVVRRLAGAPDHCLILQVRIVRVLVKESVHHPPCICQPKLAPSDRRRMVHRYHSILYGCTHLSEAAYGLCTHQCSGGPLSVSDYCGIVLVTAVCIRHPGSWRGIPSRSGAGRSQSSALTLALPGRNGLTQDSPCPRSPRSRHLPAGVDARPFGLSPGQRPVPRRRESPCERSPGLGAASPIA